MAPRHWQRGSPVSVRFAFIALALAGLGASAARAADADFEAALCHGLVDEIERAFAEQHLDRAVEPLEVGSDDAAAADRFACLSSRLARAGFVHVARMVRTDPPHGATFVSYSVPQSIGDDVTRVRFNVSRCIWNSSFWAHSGHVDFHRLDSRWGHDATVLAEFLDGFCGDRVP